MAGTITCTFHLGWSYLYFKAEIAFISALFLAKNLIDKEIEKILFTIAPLPKDGSPSKMIYNNSSHVWLHPVV